MRMSCTKSIILSLLILPVLSFAAQKSHLRGQRYCEIIFEKEPTSYVVYNTIGLNECPENIWDKITPEMIKKETGSARVHLNGPRYWVIDGLENSNLVNPKIKTFNGLEMREAGVLNISLLDLFELGAPYEQHKVARHTTWVYDSAKPIYELIDPDGNVYVMQSYSIQKIPQTEQSLSQLGSKLKLPKKWQFRTGVLNKAETVTAINNMAVVIQDDFLNTYQKATHDLLANE